MRRIIGFSAGVLALALFSCNQEKMDTPVTSGEMIEKSAQVAINEVKVEAASTESEYEVEYFANMERTLTLWWKLGQHFQWNHKLRYHLNMCPDVTIHADSINGYPKTITLDYGDSTVLRNGRVLSGIIEIYISAPRYTQEYQRTVTYTDFAVDSVTINGSASIFIDKVDTMFRKHVSDLTITLADGTEITRTSERVWQWLAGMDTPEDQTDDVLIVTGGITASMDKDGITTSYSKEITTPLKKIDDCKYFVEGVITITVTVGDQTDVSTIDYGEGTCDETATFTDSEGTVSEIDLAKREYKNRQSKNQSGKENSGKNQSGNKG